MTKDQCQSAWQALAVMLSLGDEATGNFPTCDPCIAMENYSFLALPGSRPAPSATTPADRALSELRTATHHSIKYAMEDPRRQESLRDLTWAFHYNLKENGDGYAALDHRTHQLNVQWKRNGLSLTQVPLKIPLWSVWTSTLSVKITLWYRDSSLRSITETRRYSSSMINISVMWSICQLASRNSDVSASRHFNQLTN